MSFSNIECIVHHASWELLHLKINPIQLKNWLWVPKIPKSELFEESTANILLMNFTKIYSADWDCF